MEFHGLLGEHLQHSWSPLLHSLIYKRLGYQGAYKNIPLPPDKLAHIPTALTLLGIGGVNVTIPYKQSIMPYLQEIDSPAQAIGAVNTITNTEGILKGYNTDFDGVAAMLAPFGELSAKTVVVLGNGGAARAVLAYLLANKVKQCILVSRNPREAKQQWDTTAVSCVGYDELPSLSGDMIINTTPLGMFPNVEASPLPTELHANYEAAVDVIYNPQETRFLREARQAGKRTANGLLMLIVQAFAAVKLWSGLTYTEADIAWVQKAMEEQLQLSRAKETLTPSTTQLATKPSLARPLVLVGLPGSGKTTIGTQLAVEYDLPFVDTDQYIERTTGKTVREIFAVSEQHFRDLEREALATLLKQESGIISTGGGIVVNPQNRALLKDAHVLYLKRDVNIILADVPFADRPLLKNNPQRLFHLHAQRQPFYEEVATVTYENNGTLHEDLKAIKALLAW